MATNSPVAAGNNGVSGPTKTLIDAGATLPYATVTGTLAGNNWTGNKKTAIRHSVSQTQGTAGNPTSEVYSETMNLRFAYDTDTIETDTGRLLNNSLVPRT